MSLTSYLTSKKHEECIKFQEVIKLVTPKKKDFKVLESYHLAFDTKRELEVPYNLNNPQEARLVGTTFDYLARFRIAQVVKHNSNEAVENLVAYNFFEGFEDLVPRRILRELRKEYEQIKENIKIVINNDEEIDEKMIEDVFTLSIMEHCWRGGKLPKDLNDLFNRPSEEVVEDLKRLMGVFEVNFINKVVKEDSIVKYNPSFGECSLAIGGADGDIYIDGTLYDYKCTKDLGYKGKDSQQIISYYILDRIAKKRGSLLDITLDGCDINRIAIYSARMGEIYYIDIDSINNTEIESAVLQVEDILFNNRRISLVEVEKNINVINKEKRKTSKISKKKIKIIVSTISILLMLLYIGINKTIKKDIPTSKKNKY